MTTNIAPSSALTEDAPCPPSRARLFGFRAALVFAALLPALWGVTSASAALSGGAHLVHDLIGAGVALAALWLGILTAMWRPARSPGALVCYLVFTVAAVAAAGLSRSNVAVAIVLGVQAALVTWLHPYRRAALRGTVTVSPLLLPVALLVTAALSRYAVTEAALQASGDPHALAAHYFDQAWYALAAALLAVVAAVRTDVRRFAGTAAGLAVAVFGAVSITLPETSSSLGAGWGTAALVGGIVIAGLARLADQAWRPRPR